MFKLFGSSRPGTLSKRSAFAPAFAAGGGPPDDLEYRTDRTQISDAQLASGHHRASDTHALKGHSRVTAPARANGNHQPGGSDAADLRQNADVARDAKRWGEAAALYLAYLKIKDDDFGVRVQAGNCLKEDGRFNESLAAYKTALTWSPWDADCHLQMGHVLKLMGRLDEAAKAYKTSVEFQPTDNPAADELLAIDAMTTSKSNGVAHHPEKRTDHPDSVETLQAAIDARNAERWEDAAALYFAYLDGDQHDFRIRIQAGNCLKEDGRFEESLDAYRTALKTAPDDSDGLLQMGYVLKLMGREREAARAFRSSLDSYARDNPAFYELLALDTVPKSTRPGITSKTLPCVYIDVSDLFIYLRHNVTLSGIQRVVANLVIYASDYNAKAGEAVVRPVLPDYRCADVHELDAGLLTGLISAVAVGKADRGTIDRALDALNGSRKLISLQAADTLIIAGAFWIYPRYELLNKLRQNGTLITVFIHDLIPVSYPEYVAPSATVEFRRGLVDVLAVADYILSNSEFIAKEVRRFLASRMNFEIPVTAVPLATELGYTEMRVPPSPEYVALAKDDYVLCVATLEVRKNHMYLVKLWERLDREFDGKIPNLVFVGKWGWQIEGLQQYLAGSDYLGGRLHIFNGISDRDLAFLYENCLFTMYSSFAEGWGLPIGESLGYGKPCLASNVTSMPEAGGDLCRYFDPFNLDDGYRLLAGVLADRPALADWTARIRADFRPKTWRDFSNQLLETVETRRDQADLSRRNSNCLVEVGQVTTIGHESLARIESRRQQFLTARMNLMSGWHDLETWGCWAAKRRAVLQVGTRLAIGTDVTVLLHLQTPDQDEGADCVVDVNETKTFIDELGCVPAWVTASGRVGPAGRLDIVITSGRGFYHRHGRELYVGLIAIAVVPEGDTASQTKLLSQIIRKGETRQVSTPRG